jgi:hypothetical protein
MLMVPVELRKDALIKSAIATAMEELSPSVRYIRYRIDQDWLGDWAIFFRVMLSDEVGANPVRQRVEFRKRVRDRIMHELDLPNLGMMPHFNYRYESDQAELNDPGWAPLSA